MSRQIIFLIFLFSIAVFVFSGCGLSSSDEENIFALLDIRISAINNKNPKDMDYILADNYPDRKKVMANFMLNTTFFEVLNYELVERKIISHSFFSKKVTVEQIYNLSFKIPEQPVKELKNKKELITIEKGEKGWKITDGLK